MISDEALMAYLDGEAGAASERAIEAAMARDPALRARLEALECGDRNLRAAFDVMLEEPVPDKIVQFVWAQRPSLRPAAAPVRKPPASAGWFDAVRRGWGASPAWLGWAAAAQFALLVVAGAVILQGRIGAPTAQYHALGSAPQAAAANLTVIFRPETPERSLREALGAARARIVGGPTEAGAYLLQTADAERAAALGRLRARPDVVMAEPLDPARTAQ
jgi:anti-sigma factor RsiW